MKNPANYFLRLFRSLRFKFGQLHNDYPVVLIGTILAGFFLAALVMTLLGDTNIVSLGNALWWVIVTWTTVGYGDLVPSAVEGRLVAVWVIVMGFIFTSVVSGLVASFFVERRLRENRGLKEIKLKNHIVICGWNETAESVLQSLPNAANKDHLSIVLINLLDEHRINALTYKFQTFNIKFVKGKFTDEAVLRRANITDAESVIILADESGGQAPDTADERTTLGAFTIKSLAPHVKMSVELNNREHMAHLRRAEVDDVIVRGEFMGFLLSNAVHSPGLVEAVREMLTFRQGKTLFGLTIPDRFVGQRFGDAAEYFRKEKQSIMVGVLREVSTINLEDILGEDTSALDDFIKRKFAEAAEAAATKDNVQDKVHLNPGDDYIIHEEDKALLIAPEIRG